MKNWRKLSSERSAVDYWGLWVSIGLVIGIILSLFTSIARAQPGNPPAPELPELVVEACPGASELRAGIDLDGVAGVWFPRVTSTCVLDRLDVLAEVVPYVVFLEQRAARDAARDALQARQVALAGQEADAATHALEAAVRRAREATEAMNAWHRAPMLWAVVGGAVVVVLQVVAIVIFKEVSP